MFAQPKRHDLSSRSGSRPRFHTQPKRRALQAPLYRMDNTVLLCLGRWSYSQLPVGAVKEHAILVTQAEMFVEAFCRLAQGQLPTSNLLPFQHPINARRVPDGKRARSSMYRGSFLDLRTITDFG